MHEHLSEVQKQILEIFSYVYADLQEQHVEYYMLGGTLLGAVRHKGFIPWDDDIDIGIPRAQYEAFLKRIPSILPAHLKLETYQNTPSHHYYFARVVDTRHAVLRTGSLEERAENVWVDIFPLDGMPNNPIARKIHMLRLLWTRMLYHISCFEKVNLKRPNRPWTERAVIRFVSLTGFGRRKDTRNMLERIDALLRKYPPEESDWVVNFMGQYKFKEMFPRSVYGKGALYSFEEYMLEGPEDYDAVLRQMYGDYMTPPKEAERNVHAVETKH